MVKRYGLYSEIIWNVFGCGFPNTFQIICKYDAYYIYNKFQVKYEQRTK